MDGKAFTFRLAGPVTDLYPGEDHNLSGAFVGVPIKNRSPSISFYLGETICTYVYIYVYCVCKHIYIYKYIYTQYIIYIYLYDL